MTRIDSATITLDVWDDTLGMRREVTFALDLDQPFMLPTLKNWWYMHEQRIAEEQRIRLAAKDEPGNFVL